MVAVAATGTPLLGASAHCRYLLPVKLLPTLEEPEATLAENIGRKNPMAVGPA